MNSIRKWIFWRFAIVNRQDGDTSLDRPLNDPFFVMKRAIDKGEGVKT
jgi:hypothetical protein